jgi:hypothetical protein
MPCAPRTALPCLIIPSAPPRKRARALRSGREHPAGRMASTAGLYGLVMINSRRVMQPANTARRGVARAFGTGSPDSWVIPLL